MRIPIDDKLSIDADEVSFVFARSGGPGGQNVNKLSTRATLLFDVGQSPSLSADQKKRIIEALTGRIDRCGVLHIMSQRHRTQTANRRAALQRFVELLAAALLPPQPRKATRPGRGAVERRLAAKRLRARRKQERSRPLPAD